MPDRGQRVEVANSVLGLHALVVGLMHNWMLDPKYLAPSRAAAPLVDACLDGIRAKGAK